MNKKIHIIFAAVLCVALLSVAPALAVKKNVKPAQTQKAAKVVTLQKSSSPAPANCGSISLTKEALKVYSLATAKEDNAKEECMQKHFSSCLPARLQWKFDNAAAPAIAAPGQVVIKQYEIKGRKSGKCQVEIVYQKNSTMGSDYRSGLTEMCDWVIGKKFSQDEGAKMCRGPLVDANIKRAESIEEIQKNPESEKVQTFADMLNGKILKNTFDGSGSLLYFSPGDQKIYTLASIEELSKFSSTFFFEELEKIPLANFNLNGEVDSDGDGLADVIEKVLHTDPQKKSTNDNGYDDKTNLLHQYNPIAPGSQKLPIDLIYASVHLGFWVQEDDAWIFWYVNPNDGRRYFISDNQSLWDLEAAVALPYRGVQDELDLAYRAWTARQQHAAENKELENGSNLTGTVGLDPIGIVRALSGVLHDIDAQIPGQEFSGCDQSHMYAQSCTSSLEVLSNETGVFAKKNNITGETPLFLVYGDNGGNPSCTPQSTTVCDYSISNQAGTARPKSNDYEICFFLEQGSDELTNPGVHALYSNGKFGACN